MLGAFHGSDIPDFYGISNQTDFIATDAVSKCTSPINFFHLILNIMTFDQFTLPASTIQTLQLTR